MLSFLNPLDSISVDKIIQISINLTSVEIQYVDEIIRTRKVVKTPFILEQIETLKIDNSKIIKNI